MQTDVPAPLADRERAIMRRFGVPRRTWAYIAGAITAFLSIEVPLVTLVLSATGIYRLQVVNGILLIAGGALGLLIAWLVFMWPMKRATFRMLLMQEDMQDEIRPTAQEVRGTVADIRRVFLDSDLAKRIEEHLAAIRKRIERDTEPVKVLRREATTDEADNHALLTALGVAEAHGDHDGKSQ